MSDYFDEDENDLLDDFTLPPEMEEKRMVLQIVDAGGNIEDIIFDIEEIYNYVKNAYEKCYKIVEDIYYHQFYYIAEQISKGEKNNASTFENILVKHLGSFVANEKHINKLKEIAEDRKIHEGE